MKRRGLVTLLLVGALTLSCGVSVSAHHAVPISAPVQGAQTDFRELFDAEYYLKANLDLAAIYGNDAEALYGHFMQAGIYEGRICSPLFDAKRYKEKYTDLAASCGDNYKKYCEQYLTEGIAQEEVAADCLMQ